MERGGEGRGGGIVVERKGGGKRWREERGRGGRWTMEGWAGFEHRLNTD